ncbi:hypothetical protein ACRU44_25885 [Mycobacterium colombiense]
MPAPLRGGALSGGYLAAVIHQALDRQGAEHDCRAPGNDQGQR